MALAQLLFASQFLTFSHNCFHSLFTSVQCLFYKYAKGVGDTVSSQRQFLWFLFVKTHFSPLFFPHRPISSSGKYSEYKPSWPPEPIGQNKLWKTNRTSSQLPRPPPGLTNQKQASPSPWGSGGPRLARGWGGGGINQESRFGPGTVYTGNMELLNHSSTYKFSRANTDEISHLTTVTEKLE